MIFFLIFASYWRLVNIGTSKPSSDPPLGEGMEASDRESLLPDDEEIMKMIPEERLQEIMPKEYREGLPPEYQEMFPDSIYSNDTSTKEESTIDIDNIEFATFSKEGEVAFKYPSEWTTVKEFEEEKVETEKAEFLFIAQSEDPYNPPSLAVLKMEASDIEEVLEIIKKEIEIDGANMKITEKEKKESGYILETKNDLGGVISVSRKKIVSTKEGYYYLVSVSGFSRNWEEVSPIADHIIDSIKLK